MLGVFLGLYNRNGSVSGFEPGNTPSKIIRSCLEPSKGEQLCTMRLDPTVPEVSLLDVMMLLLLFL